MIPVPPNLPGTRPDEPMPPLFTVRALYARHADVKSFDAGIEAALIEAEHAGDFRVLRAAIAGYLWSAICAEHALDLGSLPADQRADLLRARMLEWLEAGRRPAFTSSLEAQHARLDEPLPVLEGPMRGFLTDPDDDPPAAAAAAR